MTFDREQPLNGADVQTKVCSGCGESKPLTGFGGEKRKWYGHRCPDCVSAARRKREAAKGPEWREKQREYNRQYYRKNRERFADYNRRYREENRERLIAYDRRRYRDNFEQIAARKRAYAQRNAEAIAAYQRQYRLDNKERLNAGSRRYYSANRPWLREYARRRYESMSAEDKEARQAYMKNYYAANRERIREISRLNGLRWRSRNREKIRARQRANRCKNRIEKLQYERQWRRRNPDKVKATNHRRRAHLAGVPVEPFPREWLMEQFRRQEGRCYLCLRRFGSKLRLTLDHVIPLSKGGPHSPANAMLACGSCNSRKGNKVVGQD